MKIIKTFFKGALIIAALGLIAFLVYLLLGKNKSSSQAAATPADSPTTEQ